MEKLAKVLEIYKCVVLTVIALLLAVPWLHPAPVKVENTGPVPVHVEHLWAEPIPVEIGNTWPIDGKVDNTVEVQGTVSIQR